MKKLLFILLSTYALMADTLPSTISTNITNISKNGQIQLATSVPKGMSGIVIHHYSNGISAITHSVISKGKSLAEISHSRIIKHDNIPSIKTPLQANDKIVFGNFYDNALVIAPNTSTYNQITNRFQKNWVHPDAYAIDFMREGVSAISRESLKNFAEKNQIGLVLIASKNSLLILDPISQIYLTQLVLTPSNSKVINPFFTRFEQEDASTFSFQSMQYTPYYQAIKEL